MLLSNNANIKKHRLVRIARWRSTFAAFRCMVRHLGLAERALLLRLLRPAPVTIDTPTPGPAELAAAVDLGSNSFHMIVGRLAEGELHIVDKLRERVRFAAGLDDDRNITPAAMDRGIACLQRFGQRLSGMPLGRVRVVGTNTLRQAKNGRAFMDRARDALGYPIEVISGREEARLIYLGVAQTMPVNEGRRLVVDIGGGSTEVIIGDGFDIVEADSLYMGCVSYSERFFSEGKITAKRFRDAEVAAELELQSIVWRYRELGWTAAVGCSGTMHAVDTIIRANEWGDNIAPRGLKRLRKALVAAGDVHNLDLTGLQADRKAVIAGGVAILEALFNDLRVQEMTPSPGALREGLLYGLVGRIDHEDVRERTIRAFQERYHVDGAQAEQVGNTAVTLLSQATRQWPLDERWAAQQLRWASQLCEIGLAISHTGYHKHGAYLVANSYMAGFSREAQSTLAMLIVSHRRKPRQLITDSLVRRDAAAVQKLCVLFRLAVALNRARDEERPPVVLKAKKDKLRLTFPEDWLDAHPLTHASLEQEKRYLAHIGWDLTLRSAATVAPPTPLPDAVS